MSRQSGEPQDGIDARRQQWAAELPDVDTRGMAIIGRMRWLTMQLRPGIEAIFTEHGLDAGEFDVLATLLRAGTPYTLRPTELYQWLMISSGGLTARLKRLEDAGMVKRSSAPDDARSLLVALTTKGKKLAERAFRDDMAHEAKVLSALTKAEQAQLEALLRKLALAVE
ncbi:MAG: MarR family transcriptional regulator [Myxococcales bacterium]|nr:MarR family transcriptional regulator [Myxococcales bacterium]